MSQSARHDRAPPPAGTLILGGARSGKSRLAERLAVASGLSRVYIATAEPHDAEMAARIRQHQTDRGRDWTTVEAPDDLARAITRESGAGRILLVDCLTLWLSNLMLADRDIDVETEKLIHAIVAVREPIIFVSNEVGLGIVPDNALARRFRDAQGRLNQRVAATVARVIFVAAGLPLVMKGAPLALDAS